MGKRLILAGKRCRGHLRNHEAGIESVFLHQEGGELAVLRIGEHGDAPFRHGTDLRQRHRDPVGRHADWLGMEIAAIEDVAAFGIDHRIVGPGVDFGGRGRVAAWRNWSRQAPITCGWHLRAIGILEPSVLRWHRCGLRCRRGASARKSGHSNLARLAARLVQPRIESHSWP